MNAAHDTSACLRLECWLSAYVDDELDAVHCLEVEAHLDSCEECAQRLEHLLATRNSMQSLSTEAPCALRERVALLLDAERMARRDASPITSEIRDTRQQFDDAPLSDPGVAVRTSERPPPSGIARLRLIVPLAAAATIALVFGAIELQKQDAAMDSAGRGPASQTAVAAYSLDHLVEELVTQHIQSPPLDTTDPLQLNEYERHVGVRIREPHFHEAKWMGARVQPQSRAAMLRYMLKNQHRITVYMFDANRVSMASRRLAPQHRAASKVYVGNVRGYTVAAAERDGVGYAVASDLSGDETAKLAVAATR